VNNAATNLPRKTITKNFVLRVAGTITLTTLKARLWIGTGKHMLRKRPSKKQQSLLLKNQLYPRS
jgi:hypothetical protein